MHKKCNESSCLEGGGTKILKGEFKVLRITPDLYEETQELFINNFLAYENVSLACDLRASEESLNEMKLLLRATLDDGISFGAWHCATNKLVAMSANKIISQNSPDSLEDICSTFTTPQLLSVNEFLTRIECTFDIFRKWSIEHIFEIVFLATSTDFTKRGLALALSQYSIDFAQKMFHGQVAPWDLAVLPAHVRSVQPQAVTSVFTSNITQRIGEKLGFETLHRIPYTEFRHEGRTFAEKIGPQHEASTYAALRLKEMMV